MPKQPPKNRMQVYRHARLRPSMFKQINEDDDKSILFDFNNLPVVSFLFDCELDDNNEIDMVDFSICICCSNDQFSRDEARGHLQTRLADKKHRKTNPFVGRFKYDPEMSLVSNALVTIQDDIDENVYGEKATMSKNSLYFKRSNTILQSMMVLDVVGLFMQVMDEDSIQQLDEIVKGFKNTKNFKLDEVVIGFMTDYFDSRNEWENEPRLAKGSNPVRRVFDWVVNAVVRVFS